MSTVLKPENQFKTLKTIYLALFIGSVLTTAILYWVTEKTDPESEQPFFVLEYAVPLIGIFSFAAVSFFSRKRIDKAIKIEDLNEKVSIYRSAKLLLWAALEGTVIFASFGYFLSGRQNLILYAVMATVMILFYRPLKARLIEELNLTQEEADNIV